MTTTSARTARWDGVPRRVRLAVGSAAAVFVYGTVVHIVHLSAPGEPYPGMPGWLAASFASLVALDPLVAGLLALRLRLGHTAACAVLVADALANGYAHYWLDTATGLTPGRAGHAVVTLLAAALLAAGPAVRPWLLQWPVGPVGPARTPGA
ncbi:MAG TPA: hypothetical protein VFR87_09740 [Nocardioidaceae bacterium]|nr:hypothetical protein [Nocardioidaceae bacterium]